MSLICILLLPALAKLLYLGFLWSCTTSPALKIWPVRLRWKHERNKAIFKNYLFILGNVEPCFQHLLAKLSQERSFHQSPGRARLKKAIADKHTHTISLNLRGPVGFVCLVELSSFHSTDLTDLNPTDCRLTTDCLRLLLFAFGSATWNLGSDWRS